MSEMITGKMLIDWGLKPGKHFPAALAAAQQAQDRGDDPCQAALAQMPPEPLKLRAAGGLAFFENVTPDSPAEEVNVAAVRRDMSALMRVSTVESGAIMPDACPAGTIPVGGVVATKGAIHPGFHSADICCSVALTILGAQDPKAVLDTAMAATHFGYGGRRDPIAMPAHVSASFAGNAFLRQMTGLAERDFASQGDGNHFLYVGRLASSGEVAIVTHHGSRGPGAALYKAGMRLAETYRRDISPETPKGAAWIPSETEDGRSYWSALQAIRAWTEASHFAIHDLIVQRLGASVRDRFWNEHNFVFERDGLFYHAKGATPGWNSYDRTLVPLTMADPILITRGRDAANGLGFLPHGAGRNMSRTKYLASGADLSPPDGIDWRFFSGSPDPSEFPGAYKSAATIIDQMRHYGLADVLDVVEPYGSIMAGELEKFWLKAKEPAQE